MSRTASVMDDSDQTEFANQIKEVLIRALHKEGMLVSGVHPEQLNAEFCVVITRSGFLGKIWSKIRGHELDKAYIQILKAVDRD